MDRKLLIVMPLAPGDLANGLELLKLWVDMEDKFNERVSVAICVRFDMTIEKSIPKDIIKKVESRFKTYTKVIGKVGVGWPAGCNALEIGAYEWFVEANRKGEIDYEYMLIAEADTVPLRKFWHEEIMNEAYEQSAMIIGAYFSPEEGCAHINGNCVIHRDAWKSMRNIWRVPPGRGWDCYIGPSALRIGKPSRLIWQDYRLGAPDNPWKGDDFLFSPKIFGAKTNPLYGENLQPAMIHGVKTLQGIQAVRKRILKEVVDK